MKTVIAICENEKCGTIFSVPNLIYISGNVQVEFVGSKLGPCPKCGSFGRIPNGVYQMIDQTLELIKGPKESIEILSEIQQILKNFNANPTSKEEVIDSIQKLSPTFAEKLKDFKNASYHTWIQTFIAIIGLAILIQQSYFKGNDNDLKDKIIYDLVNQVSEKPKEVSVNVSLKIQRNDPCPCHSGKKYKKCCIGK